jgi:hypothetical protein
MMSSAAPEAAVQFVATLVEEGGMMLVRAVTLAMIVGGLVACANERSDGPRYDRSTGYGDFRTERPHGLETLDRRD